MPDTLAKLPCSSNWLSTDGPQHYATVTNALQSYAPASTHRATKARTGHTRRRSNKRLSPDIDPAKSPCSPHQTSDQDDTPSPTPSRPTTRFCHVAIGKIFSNGETGQDQYRCVVPGCNNKTFGRLAELKRHHAGKHAAVGRKPQFWCPVKGCERSRAGQGEAFPRRDKMFDHLSRMHPDIVGS
jgi:hypothetical protein